MFSLFKKYVTKKNAPFFIQGMVIIAASIIGIYIVSAATPVEYTSLQKDDLQATTSIATSQPVLQPLDIALYNKKLLQLANYPVTASSSASSTSARLWPVKTVYPNAGALLPFNRIVAYYGNFYSKQMGVLGQYPPQQVVQMLQQEAAKWQAADPSTPVIPAIDYIAVTAQGSPGVDGKYSLRMPKSQIEKAIALADQVHGLVFLDVQVGLSTLQTELPLLEPYLKLPQVELSIDPEFSMKTGARPGTVIGTFDATDINYAANYLASLVRQNNLPPKILVVHRFTEDMVTHYRQITPLPEVQIVMDMDGWGYPAKKIHTYKTVIASEPVQFTGFKLFYKADLQAPSNRLLTPQEVLSLQPQPSYIQYQ